MHHPEHDYLTEREKLILHELLKYSTEDTPHFTVRCFEQTYRLGEKAAIFATKFFYSSLFGHPEECRWVADNIIELPDIYKKHSLLHLARQLSSFYDFLVERNPKLHEMMKIAYQEWVKNREEDQKKDIGKKVE